MSWEDAFRSWAKNPCQTEQDKCDNAVRAVRKAIENSQELSTRNVSIFPQGSYNNRTNIGSESDVDIGVLCSDTFIFDLPNGHVRENFNISPATYTYSEYKAHIQNALTSHFGIWSVKRGNKAFDIHENGYRVDADVVPYFEYRKYQTNGTYLTGVCFYTDKENELVINWPDQNYTNGVEKNTRTGYRFKAMVRTIKNLRVQMEEDNIDEAKPIPSFLIESMVWNVPDEGFNHTSYMADVRYILAHLFNHTRILDECREWGEVNDIKYLFLDGVKPWTLAQAHMFISKAWDYVEFE